MERTYDQLLKQYMNDFAPRGCDKITSHEVFLIQQMARAHWKLDRLQALEETALEDLLTDPAASLKNLYQSNLAALHRFAAAAERSYFKAHKELQAARRTAPFAQDKHKQQPAPQPTELDALAQAIEAIAHAPMPKLRSAAAPKPLTKAEALRL